MFPFKVRATYINIVVLVSKSVTIAAPFVNEMDEPTPLVFMICIQAFILVVILFFKSKSQLDKMQRLRADHQKLN